MIPLINIGLRAARSASEQIMRSLERLDMIHDEGSDLSEPLAKICQAAERTLAYEIHQSHPDQEVIGVHNGAMDSPTKPATKHWKVNPIDGLTQYAQGIPTFTLTLACYEEDKLTHSIVIDCVSGDEYCASKGRSAQLNGRRIRASKRQHLNGSQIYGGYAATSESAFDHYQRVGKTLFEQQARSYSQMSDNLALVYVATGKFDGLWHSGLDATADAGLLIAQEAGALASDFHGGKALNRGELVCANPKLLKQLLISLRNSSRK